MGKSLQSAARLQELSRFLSSAKVQRPKQSKSRLPIRVSMAAPPKSGGIKVESQPPKAPLKMEPSEKVNCRIPLAQVVSDCVKRWFQDTLKEAKAGDSSMQLLVGQMYNSGYGVTKDPRKGSAWISKASRGRESVWAVGEKRPGYRVSDSDSEDPEMEAQ